MSQRSKNVLGVVLPSETGFKLKSGSYYQRNREACLARTRVYLQDPDKYKQTIIANAKHRAKRKGIEFALTKDQVDWPSHCPVFGWELPYRGGGDGRTSPSLDRIDNTKGYLPDNVQVISVLANVMKLDATPEELRKFAKWIL